MPVALINVFMVRKEREEEFLKAGSRPRPYS